jgi:hypothetical protein
MPRWAGTLAARLDSTSRAAGNPIVVGQGLCDPQARVYDGHVYLYATHDAVPGSNAFVMNDWRVWYSGDLVHWKHVSTLKPEYAIKGTTAWATPRRAVSAELKNASIRSRPGSRGTRPAAKST